MSDENKYISKIKRLQETMQHHNSTNILATAKLQDLLHTYYLQAFLNILTSLIFFVMFLRTYICHSFRIRIFFKLKNAVIFYYYYERH